MKKEGYILSIILVIVLIIIILGYTGLLTKITGYATSDTTVVNITVGNNLPTIGNVETITAKNPTDDTTTSITFNFTATDTDGASNINTSSAKAYFQRA